MRIKIFGERNTATNALEKLIRLNSCSYVSPGALRVNTNAQRLFTRARRVTLLSPIVDRLSDHCFFDVPPDQEWKHAATNFASVESLTWHHVIFTVRHPLSWLLAFYQRPYHVLQPRPSSLYSFMLADWQTVERDRLGGISVPPLELYRIKINSYIKLVAQLEGRGITSSFVRHEDIILRQGEVIKGLLPYLDRPSSHFAPLEAPAKKGNRNLNHYAWYYGNEKWRDEIPVEVTRAFQFDRTLMKRFGYS